MTCIVSDVTGMLRDGVKDSIFICSVINVVASSYVKGKKMQGLSSEFRLKTRKSAFFSFQRVLCFMKLGTET